MEKAPIFRKSTKCKGNWVTFDHPWIDLQNFCNDFYSLIYKNFSIQVCVLPDFTKIGLTSRHLWKIISLVFGINFLKVSLLFGIDFRKSNFVGLWPNSWKMSAVFDMNSEKKCLPLFGNSNSQNVITGWYELWKSVYYYLIVTLRKRQCSLRWTLKMSVLFLMSFVLGLNKDF